MALEMTRHLLVSIIQHIIFEKFIWYPSKYHEMKILLPVTSAKIWPESGMLTVNIAKRLLVNITQRTTIQGKISRKLMNIILNIPSTSGYKGEGSYWRQVSNHAHRDFTEYTILPLFM